MGNHGADLLSLCSRQCHQHMLHRQFLLTDDVVRIFHQKIINIGYNACCGVLDRKHGIIGFAPRNRLHRLFPGIYVKACNRIIEKFFHRTETVGALHTLENNSFAVCREVVNLRVIGHLLAAVFCQQLILTLPADRHDLLEQLLDAFYIECICSLACQLFQLLALTFRIKNGFSCLYLVLRNLRRQRHPVLEQADDLVIGGIDLVADFS